jgi:hypothetical protein
LNDNRQSILCWAKCRLQANQQRTSLSPVTASASQGPIHSGRRLLLQDRHDVAVGVKGDPHLAMAQRLYHDPRGYSLDEQERRRGVAKIMEPQTRKSRANQHALKYLRHTSSIEWATDLVREDEVFVPATPPLP